MQDTTSQPSAAPQSESRPYMPNYLKPNLFSILLVSGAIAIAGFVLMTSFARQDIQRDQKIWQDKLNLMADSRAGAVKDWVDNHFVDLKKLAANPSLQLYFTELRDMPKEVPLHAGEPPAASGQDLKEPAQKSYLRNLLIFTADRLGFVPQSMPLSVQIPTQIPYESPSGIAVVDMDNNIVVSTPYLSELQPQVREQLAKLKNDEPTLIDMFRGEQGLISIGFVVPVYGIQADPAASRPIARVVGVKNVGEPLFKLLHQPGANDNTLTAMLVRRDGDNVTYLSPLSESGGALEKSLAARPDSLAEAYAIANPGAFGDGRDYQNTRVLFTGRTISSTPWTLVMKIDFDQAMAESQMRRSGMIAILVLVIGVVVLTVFAVWYKASSRRALMATRYFKEMAERTRAQEKMLKLVSDNQPEAIFILDKDRRYCFSNSNAAIAAEMNAEDMLGKQINDVLGAGKAQDIIDTAEAAIYNQHRQTRVRRINEGGDEVIVRSEFMPLAHVPLPGLVEPTPGVLVVEQDITEVVHERERRLRLHRQLIVTLIAIVDKRDPNAANHSMLVSQIAYDVANAMGLDANLCDTARIAGSLMNIGKIAISPQLLTKREDLNEEERRQLKDSLGQSADLLRGISFEGPVVETLEQMQERWDGTGPSGLKEEGILLSARIIAAVNAFVGMISPRTYRSPMTIDNALKALLEQVDTHYDRKVVVALSHYIDNQGGRIALETARAA